MLRYVFTVRNGDMKMKVNYITIEREYGSGGTRIARELSESCGIPCYGEEILESVASVYDISVEQIQKYEENVTGSFLYSIYAMSRLQSGNTEPLTEEGRVFLAEQREIVKMAANGQSIFLGHCACEALKDKSGLIKVFIRCSDNEVKRNRIIREYGIVKADAESVRKRFDKKRSGYYYSNTGKKWNDMSNYDIVLDSAKLGTDGCVGALKGVFRSV